MSPTAWEGVALLCSLVWTTWTFAGCAVNLIKTFGGEPAEWIRHLRAELRPFSLAMVIGTFVCGWMAKGEVGRGDAGFFVISVITWWINYRWDKDDDDRWKRRREALANRVAEVGGRLQVVPVVNR